MCSCKPPAVLEPGAPKTGKQPFVAARGKKSPRFRVRAVERLCGNSSGQLPQAGVLWGSQDLLVSTRCTDADGRETMRGRRSVEAASTLWVAVASQGEPKLPRALPLRPTRCCDNNGGPVVSEAGSAVKEQSLQRRNLTPARVLQARKCGKLSLVTHSVNIKQIP